MAIKHNNQIPHNHFRKDWQRRVRCHFDQPGRKLRRRNARRAKAIVVAPRPVDRLRPIVRCPTIKYNRRVRAGRGFSLEELKAAGIPRKFAPTIGIAVDGRRRNLSEESLTDNVARLKEYQKRLILFPRKAGKAKQGDSSKEDLDSKATYSIEKAFPIITSYNVQECSTSEMPTAHKLGAYATLRMARSNARLEGKRKKRDADKAQADADKKL